MKNLREIIPNNIIALRKSQGLTQLDLAKKVNYSDKAVSRWEKGEVMPDIETLQSISMAFNVPLEYLLQEHNEDPTEEQKFKYTIRNEIAFRILMVLAVWFIATIIFALGEIYYNTFFWKIFIWAVPVSCFILMYLNRKQKNQLLAVIVRSILCWSLITSIYLQFLDSQAWIVFLVGIPIQAALVIAYLTKQTPSKKK